MQVPSPSRNVERYAICRSTAFIQAERRGSVRSSRPYSSADVKYSSSYFCIIGNSTRSVRVYSSREQLCSHPFAHRH